MQIKTASEKKGIIKKLKAMMEIDNEVEALFNLKEADKNCDWNTFNLIYSKNPSNFAEYILLSDGQQNWNCLDETIIDRNVYFGGTEPYTFFYSKVKQHSLQLIDHFMTRKKEKDLLLIQKFQILDHKRQWDDFEKLLFRIAPKTVINLLQTQVNYEWNFYNSSNIDRNRYVWASCLKRILKNRDDALNVLFELIKFIERKHLN